MTNPIPQRDINKMVLQLCNDDPEKLKEIHLMIRHRIHPGLTEEARATYQKEYYIKNKEYVKAKNKKWYDANKKKAVECNKNSQRRFRDNNPDKMKEKIMCDQCNCEFQYSGLTMHRRTKKHLKNVQTQQHIEPEQPEQPEQIRE
jgi:hypothetical protein